MPKWRTDKSLSFAIAMIGFTATSSQIVLVREFINVFYGNELCLGLILGNWLLWGAVGSWALGRIADRIKNGLGLVASLEIFVAMLLPASVFFVRSARVLLKVHPGELMGMLPLVGFAFLTLAPLCSTLGFLFTLTARLFPASKGAKQIGNTYILEGVGASVGGLSTSLLMIKYLNSFQIVMVAGALNITSAMFLRTFIGKSRSVKFIAKLLIFLVLIFYLYQLIPLGNRYLAIFSADKLHLNSLVVQWGPFGFLESRNSIYSNLTVIGSEDNYNFYSNGLKLFTVPDPASAEQVAHFPMLEHPDPKKVLLIGGGISGSLGEILKHGVSQVDYVELDPELIDLARKWLKSEYLRAINDPRVNVQHIDGRLFVKRTREKYDVAIVDLAEPSTAQLNRFYTKEFFTEVRNVLTEGGLLSMGVVSSANYLSAEHQMFLNCVYKTMSSVFVDVITIPAEDQIIFVACKSKGILTYDREVLSERLRQRSIQSLYVSEYQMPFWLEPWRIRSFSERIKQSKDVRLNTDLYPVSYYYDMVLWATQFSTGSWIQSKYKDIFKLLSRLNLWLFMLPPALVGIILFIAGYRRPELRREYVLLSIMVTGFAEIAFEVIVSLAFQIMYGYMYYKLGLILTAFMVGLIVGSLIMVKQMDKLKDDLKTFMFLQLSVCIYPMILLVTFYIFKGSRAYFIGSNIIFPLLPVIAGFIGGAQFPLATKIYLQHKRRVGRVAGTVYGADLVGACLGALIVSAFLVPILGIPNTCIAISLLSLIVFVLILFHYVKPSPFVRDKAS